jgi:hypothetical protein
MYLLHAHATGKNETNGGMYMSNVSWDLDTNTGSSTGGGKANFAKFPEGITRIRVIDEAPFQRWTHFMKKFNRSINCPGKGCPICDIRRVEKTNKVAYTHQMAKRYALNIINRETGRVEILEQGKTFIQDLKDNMTDLAETGKSLIDADIKVRRRGMGQDDTSYRLDVEKTYPLSADDEKLIKEKVDLKEYFKPHTPEQILRVLQGEAWEDVMKTQEGTSEPHPDAHPDHIDLQDEEIEIS